MNVRIHKCDPRAVVPEYKTPGSVAFDIHVIEDAVIPARQGALLRTGLVIETPAGYGLFLAARSSLFPKKGLMLANGVGIIDQDFCGAEDELKISLWNATDAPVSMSSGERLAQGFFAPIERAQWEHFDPKDQQSRGGIGSTGS